MALDWRNIPTTDGNKAQVFKDLDVNTEYNLEFLPVKDHKIFHPKNSKVKSGFLGIFKLKVISNEGKGTYVQWMANLDEADEKWIGQQQNLIIKVAEQAGLNRLEFPSNPADLMKYLSTNLPEKKLSARVREAGEYNGRKQWSMDGWSVGTLVVEAKRPTVDNLVTPQEEVPTTEEFDF